ncbi:MAG: protein-glutamate O-methyltransferase CheR [Gemmatimonadales bacterium]
MKSANDDKKPATWSSPEFGRIARDVEARTGILFPQNRIASADASMQRVMTRLRITNPVSLEIAVSRPGSVRDALMAELTIGESYFFREPAQLRFFAEDLLPEWNATWPVGRRLRVLSTACAGGQEPYSLAILLKEKNWTRPHRIVGTDISEARLEGAKKATFTKWSLRTMSQDRINRWFQNDGTKYDLDPSIARDVEFAPMNLAEQFPPEMNAQDAIFCRNVLIYFDIPTITRIAERLLNALSPEGWLFLGASDLHIADLTPCEAVVLPGATAYRRCSEGVSGYSLRNAPLTLIEPLTESVDQLPFAGSGPAGNSLDVFDEIESGEPAPSDHHFRKADHPADILLVAEAASAGSSTESADSRAAEIRQLANQGLLKEAGKALAAALETHPRSADLHLLESVLLSEAGRWADAERAARRALYLDRTLTLAHVALGDALAKQGDARAAKRNFESAAALIAAAERRGDTADTDGVPLARLLHIVRAHLSAMGGGSPDRGHSVFRKS